MGLLQIALQFFEFLAWPLLALVYPLCCSIRAIENNSNSDIQKLNTYWVVFSLSLLFEHAFLKLLQWLPMWPYIRIMIVFLLVMPQFDGAFYVYKHLICPCLAMDPEVVINWFNKRRKESTVIRENFLAEVERFIKENGPEAFERMVACKVSHAEPNLTETAKSKFAAVAIKEKVLALEVTADREIPMTPPSKEVEKDGTCFISQVRVQSGTSLESYLDGGQNMKAAYGALGMKNQAEPNLTQIEKDKVNPLEVASGRAVLESSEKVQNEWVHALCQVTIPSEITLNSYLEQRIHKAAYEAPNSRNWAYVPKMALSKSDKHKDPLNSAPSSGSKPMVIIKQKVQAEEPGNNTSKVIIKPKVRTDSGSKPKVIIRKMQSKDLAEGVSSVVQGQQWNTDDVPTSASKPKVIIRKVQPKAPVEGVSSLVQGQQWNPEEVPRMKDHRRLWCAICSVRCPGEIDLAAHLSGRKHKENVQGQQRNPEEVPRRKDHRLWCAICSVRCPGEIDLAAHLGGRKHKENVQEQRDGDGVQRKKGPPLWCKICEVGCYSEFDMKSHLRGRRHFDCLLN